MAGLSTAPVGGPTRPGRGSGPSPVEVLRLGWRGLTSMRTALLLLFLLALEAVPGSVLPQRSTNPFGVVRYRLEHPNVSPLLDALGWFDVFASPLFVGTYVLVLISLVGCVVPRSRLHWRAVRRQPPRAPSRLDRLPWSVQGATSAAPAAAAEVWSSALRAKRWRVVVREEPDGVVAVSAEKGYLRETGNLVFHLALIAIVVGVALASILGYQGTLTLVEGEAVTTTAVSYDTLRPGRLVDPEDLESVTVALDDFRAQFLANGQPAEFQADVRVGAGDADPTRAVRLAVNSPMAVGAAKVYLLGHGYAPVLAVRDRAGRLLSEGPVPFVGRAGGFATTGVLKVPDVGPGLPQIGVRAAFYPTVDVTAEGDLVASSPEARAPAMSYEGFAGDLGLDSGLPQNVHVLDTRELVSTGGGLLLPGQTSPPLAGGATLTFVGVREYVVLQVTKDPGKPVVLVGSVASLLGLLGSLFVRRRRLWVRASPQPGGTVVVVGALGRSDPGATAAEATRLLAGIAPHLAKPTERA